MNTHHRSLVFVCSIFFLAQCHTTSVTANESPPSPGEATVYFESSGNTISIQAELAITPEDRARGLMDRTKLAQNRGMVFIAPQESIQSFWMKNTFIPLDMIFVNSKGRIVGIVHNAEPLSLVPRRVEFPSSLVIEVNGGFCKRHGISAETKIALKGLPKNTLQP